MFYYVCYNAQNAAWFAADYVQPGEIVFGPYSLPQPARLIAEYCASRGYDDIAEANEEFQYRATPEVEDALGLAPGDIPGWDSLDAVR